MGRPGMALLALLLVTGACTGGADDGPVVMEVTSGPLDGPWMAPQFTCDGWGISPPFVVQGLPEGTVALAMVFDDADGAVHWHLTGIPPPRGGRVEAEVPVPGSTPGPTSFGHDGYQPPCPAPGQTGRYRFTVYALGADVPPPADPAAARAAYEAAALALADIDAEYTLDAGDRPEPGEG